MLLCAYACPLVVAAGAPHVTGTYHRCAEDPNGEPSTICETDHQIMGPTLYLAACIKMPIGFTVDFRTEALNGYTDNCQHKTEGAVQTYCQYQHDHGHSAVSDHAARWP